MRVFQFEQHASNFLNATLQARYVGPYDTSDVISVAFDSANILVSYLPSFYAGVTGKSLPLIEK